jgi:serine/threonine protein kinase
MRVGTVPIKPNQNVSSVGCRRQRPVPEPTFAPMQEIMRAAAASADRLLGRTINGAYRIDRLLARGGMGNIYEAAEVHRNQRVALKVMSPELAADEEALALFFREAEVTRWLVHPHIVRAFDFGITRNGEPYLVMELLQGEDLDQRLRREGRLSSRQTLRVIKQTAAALAATHAKGIIHRDLKPANIFLQMAGGHPDRVKVLDFGISTVFGASEHIRPAFLMGTPRYMAPEQALGQTESIDARTDQWALACIAWEALCGHTPFVADTIPCLLFQVVHEAPPVLPSAPTGFSPKLEGVLRQALSKRQEDRYQSVLEFAQAMEDAMEEPASGWSGSLATCRTRCPTVPRLAS